LEWIGTCLIPHLSQSSRNLFAVMTLDTCSRFLVPKLKLVESNSLVLIHYGVHYFVTVWMVVEDITPCVCECVNHVVLSVKLTKFLSIAIKLVKATFPPLAPVRTSAGFVSLPDVLIASGPNFGEVTPS
jgi:hypothetical protein